MDRITSKSPAHEKLLAIIEVQAAITALKLVHDRGLGTGNMSAVVGELKVFEKQLTEMLESNLPNQ